MVFFSDNMKKIGIIVTTIIVLILLVIITLFYLKENKAKKSLNSPIEVFHFSYNIGNDINSYVYYSFEVEDGKLLVSFEDDYINDNVVKYEVDDSFRDKLNSIIKNNKIYKWDGFKKVDKHVLDGNEFSLYLRREDGSDVEASGYQRWPSNYEKVRDEIDILFKSVKE